MSSAPLPDTSLSNFAYKRDVEDDGTSTLHQPTLNLSDDEPEGEEDDFEYRGDYSSRMEELMDDDDEEGFVYTGIDVQQPSGGYRDQLRDVLGAEHDEDETEEYEVESSLLHDIDSEKVAFGGDISLVSLSPSSVWSVRLTVSQQAGDMLSDHSPSTSSVLASVSLPSTPLMGASVSGTPSKLAKPFLHPTVSRLRSYTPQQRRAPSNDSVGTFHSHIFDGMSPSPSHFSAISRTSSLSNLNSAFHGDSANGHRPPPREVFRWTHLRHIGNDIFAKTPSKAASVLGTVLGSVPPGSPTVLAANGLICIGTDTGRIFIYDFKQTLKCVCGSDSTGVF
jgi:vacuolar protein sorting-associated protein 8